MSERNSLIIGMGQIGQGLYEVLLPHHGRRIYTRDKEDCCLIGNFDILNICIPYSERFVDIVNNYVDKYKPTLTIIHSTVPVGTTRSIKGKAVHSPVRAKHPNIAHGLSVYKKFIGYNDDIALQRALNYLSPCMECVPVEKTESTELAKLLCLAEYGIDIAFADYANRLCNKLGLDYHMVREEWNKTYNEGIRFTKEPYLQRPVVYPPTGKIGGHCVLQNTILLNEQFKSPLLEEVIRVGEEEKKNTGKSTKIWNYCNIYHTAKIGDNCVIGSYSEIGDGVVIGDNCKLGAYTFVPKGVTIGNNVFIGPRVGFTNDKYPKAVGEWKVRETIVEDDVSIGSGSTIVCGVKLGKDCKIGAGSVVTKDVPAGEVWFGNPAKRQESKWL
jgi:acetyltransferase-like isoleucine patch superfamily enzyme